MEIITAIIYAILSACVVGLFSSIFYEMGRIHKEGEKFPEEIKVKKSWASFDTPAYLRNHSHEWKDLTRPIS